MAPNSRLPLNQGTFLKVRQKHGDLFGLLLVVLIGEGDPKRCIRNEAEDALKISIEPCPFFEGYYRESGVAADQITDQTFDRCVCSVYSDQASPIGHSLAPK